MTFRTKSCRFLLFWGNVDHFHLVPSKMLAEVGICTQRKLDFRKQAFHAFLCGVKILNDADILLNCVDQNNYYVESFSCLFNTT